MAILQGNQGQTGKAVGQNITAGFGEFSDVLVTELMPRYFEWNNRGVLWTLSSAAAGSALVAASAIGQTAWAPSVGIFNPVNSGVNCVILKGLGSFVSGTPGAGGLVWGFIAPNAGVTATGGNGAVNGKSLVTGGSNAKTFVQAAMTGSAASVMLWPLADAFAAAIAATSTNLQDPDEVAGLFICPPGGVIGIGGSGTPVVQCAMSWIEVPV